MSLTLATELANYAAGIGTQGATLTIDSANKRVGVGTTNPQGPEGTLQVGTGITFFGNTGIISATGGRFSGDFNVAGALTFEDVTNIDSLGFGTFRSGLTVQGAGSTTTTLSVSGVSTFTGAINGNVTGNISGGTVAGSTGTFSDVVAVGGDANNGTADGIRLQTDGLLQLSRGSGVSALFAGYTQGSSTQTVRINNDGTATFKGDLTIADKIIHDGDTNTAIRFPAADTVTVETAGSERLRVDSSGVITVPDNGYLKLGTGGDLELFHNVYDSYIDNNTQDFRIRNTATNCRHLYLQSREDLRFEAGLSERLRISSAGNVGINSTSPDRLLSVGGDMGLYRSGTEHGTYYVYKDNVATAWFKYRGDTNVVIIGTNAGDKLTINPSGDLNVAGITTATQLFEGTTRVATSGKAIAMALIFG